MRVRVRGDRLLSTHTARNNGTSQMRHSLQQTRVKYGVFFDASRAASSGNGTVLTTSRLGEAFPNVREDLESGDIVGAVATFYRAPNVLRSHKETTRASSPSLILSHSFAIPQADVYFA